jgi:hypothetical protein
MAYILTVDVIPEGGGCPAVRHIFFGESKDECRENFQKHAAGCEFLTPAIEEGRVHTEISHIDDDEWPVYDPN